VTAKTEKKNGESKDRELTFKCKFCEKSKPINDMIVMTKFFPPVVLCRECERKMR